MLTTKLSAFDTVLVLTDYVQLECVSESNPSYLSDINWFFNKTLIANNSRFSFSDNNRLLNLLNLDSKKHDGIYHCQSDSLDPVIDAENSIEIKGIFNWDIFRI